MKIPLTRLKRCAKFALGSMFRRQVLGASVLMYHSIGENAAFFTVRIEEFVKQMDMLAASKKEVVTFSELVRRYKSGASLANLVSITFDDGYLDTLKNALPILRRYGFRGSIFAIPGRLGQTYATSDGVTLPLFSADQWRYADGADTFELLPHTLNHLELPKLTAIEARHEILESHAVLERIFDADIPRILAYPRGKYVAETVDLMHDIAWEAACTVEPGLMTCKTDVFRIPRNSVDSQTTLDYFRFLLSDGVEWHARLWLRGF